MAIMHGSQRFHDVKEIRVGTAKLKQIVSRCEHHVRGPEAHFKGPVLEVIQELEFARTYALKWLVYG